uniref:Putative glycoside hydrolase n=1 Tax=Populus trichocarpa TaxID=3694 RepID=A0A2I6U1X3_POPTR|nr:putative glycoside hydrolase [Populus trichocarpa]
MTLQKNLHLKVQYEIICIIKLDCHNSRNRRKQTVPDDFVFGTSSSAYQYEGETNKHGRGPAIWDTFTVEHTERINDRSNGNVAVDFYHRYKEEVQRMKEMGMDAFRFSISWSRVLPHGRLSAGVNEEGIKFYNDLIDDLLKNGLQPYVTLFHWDTPQALEDKYGGFLSPNIVNDFRDFVDLCFQNFGDRVKKWITLNEPWMFSVQGYDMGTMAPGRISVVVNDPHRSLNTGATEVYTVSHHLLLAHAAAVKLYKEKYQSCQGGQIGITLVSHWFEPYSNSEADQNATKRSLDFMLGWFMDPLTNGDYPRNMHDARGGKLSEFTAEESKMLKGSYDFIGINYYTTYYAQNIDANYYTTYDVNNNASSLKEALNDPIREKSYKDHLKNVLRSINEHGVDVKGFFAWSLMDNFEWGSGYAVRFGLYYVDYKNDLKRYPKQSVKWFKQFLRRDSHSPIPHTYPLITSNETSKIEDSLVRDAKRPRNA